MVLLEFTIEPFVDGLPGPHVTAAVAAAESLGAVIEFGPFGSSCRVPGDLAGAVAGAVLSAAMANGATHVSLHAARADDGPDDDGASDADHGRITRAAGDES